MKKALLLTLSLGLLFSLPSCQNQDAEKKIVNITFGRLYDKDKSEKIENHLDIINYAELTTLVESNKEFVLFVYDKNNAKWADYEKTILGFTEKENAIINAIDRKSFKEGYDLFGLGVKEGEETFAAFSDGKLVVQRTTDGENDELLDSTAFSSWMKENIHFSNMLYATKGQLLERFSKGRQTVIGFLRNSCPDCTYVEEAVLEEFNAKDNYTSFVIDCDVEGIRYKNGEFNETSWNGFKNTFGLDEKSNPDFGYRNGVVPTFYVYSAMPGIPEKDTIFDGCVYLNDEVSQVDGEYVVTDSYFTEERKPLLNFLGNWKLENRVLKGHKIEEKDIENGKWKKEAAAEYHNPLLNAFLTAYLAK